MEFLKRSTNGRAGRRPRLMLGDQALPVLEPRVVPTILFGPVFNPQYGTTTVFNEQNVNGIPSMVATVTLAPGSPSVNVLYQGSANATANSTTAGGEHNGRRQVLFENTAGVLTPTQRSITLVLAEGFAGRDQNQTTGTQFDVTVDPTTDTTRAHTINVAGIIAYRPPLTAAAPATLDFASAPIAATVSVDATLDPASATAKASGKIGG